jgi:integrase
MIRGVQTVTIAAALDWVKTREPGVVTTISPRRITAVRGFARYLSGIDPATEVPPLGLVRYRQRRGQIFLYSDAGISAIMAAAKETIPQPLRAATYHLLIGLLAAAGLRIAEAIKLDRDDIAWTEGVLHIRETKFGHSRFSPRRRRPPGSPRHGGHPRPHVSVAPTPGPPRMANATIGTLAMNRTLPVQPRVTSGMAHVIPTATAAAAVQD